MHKNGAEIAAKRDERLIFALSRKRPNELSLPIGKNCFIDRTVKIGKRTTIGHNVVIIGRVVIGDNCIIRSGAVIGEEGFSWGFDKMNIPIRFIHLGGIIIGNNVEIGSQCHIARATLEEANTIIEDNVKLDTMVHIAHNARIGARTCMASGCIIAGSVVVGKDCWMATKCNTTSNITIGDRVLGGTGSNIIRDIPDNAIIAGNPARILRTHNDRRADSYS